MMISAYFVAAALLLGAHPGAMPQAQETTAPKPAAVAVPDTPAGAALKEFIISFNAGGEKRRAWVEGRTTVDKASATSILEQDAAFLAEHGEMTVVKVPKASASTIEAVVRHAKTGAHGHLTINVEPADPHKVTNMQLRAATPEEIKGL